MDWVLNCRSLRIADLRRQANRRFRGFTAEPDIGLHSPASDNHYLRRMNGTRNCFFSLGSNMGDSRAMIMQAIALLGTGDLTVGRVSSLYKTAAWGKTDQPDFLNAVIEIETSLDAEALLEFILQTEKKMGRERHEKWGPRTIDIDILFYGNEIIHSDRLTVPHPQMQLRKFVLVPLAEIAAEFVHPVFQKNIGTLLAECSDPSALNPVF